MRGLIRKEHYASVRKIAPRDRLSWYRLRSGWEPLCEISGKKVHDVPCPRLNEDDELKKRAWDFQIASLVNAAKNLAIIGGALAAGVCAVLWVAR